MSISGSRNPKTGNIEFVQGDLTEVKCANCQTEQMIDVRRWQHECRGCNETLDLTRPDTFTKILA